MNQFLPRAESVASVVSARDHGPANVQRVAATSPTGAHAEADTQRQAQLREKSAFAANYAKLQANIANVVARLDPPRPNGAALAAEADQSLMALMPQPVVVLPMPPADPHMIQFVAQVAQSLASQAAMARAAQSHVSPGLADWALH